MKYLYYTGRYSDNGIYRSEITRETDANYWIKSGHNETKISKKTMSVGGTWDRTHFYIETDELLSKYQDTVLKHKFLKKLEELKDCKDKNIMEQVVRITIEKGGE